MHWQDYLCFVCNLINCIKLGRNTSFDRVANIAVNTGVDSYSDEGKPVVFIMDNASIHTSIEVKELLNGYNMLYLPSYSPHLNPIELWFSQLRKQVAKGYYKTLLQLRKGIVNAVKRIRPSFYANTYRRLLKVVYKAYQREDLNC